MELSPAIKQFIARHIESLAQLEVLFYIRQTPGRPVQPQELANTLALTAEMSSAILADLARRGFAIKQDAGFSYQVAGEVDSVIELLADAYRTRRIAVTSEIYSKPLEKVKTFAEAFRLRREE